MEPNVTHVILFQSWKSLEQRLSFPQAIVTDEQFWCPEALLTKENVLHLLIVKDKGQAWVRREWVSYVIQDAWCWRRRAQPQLVRLGGGGG